MTFSLCCHSKTYKSLPYKIHVGPQFGALIVNLRCPPIDGYADVEYHGGLVMPTPCGHNLLLLWPLRSC